LTARNDLSLRGRNYGVLLALLCISLAIETFGTRGAERLLFDAFATVLGIAVWAVVFQRPPERGAMVAVFATGAAMSWGRFFVDAGFDHALFLVGQALLMLFLWSAVYVILRDLFSTRLAGAESVLGAICGYLIAGGAWGRLNAITYLLLPSAYSINPEVAALLCAGADDRLQRRDAGARAGDDVEPVRRIVWRVLYGRRRIAVCRTGAVQEGRRPW
jgi:hypothetical protein